MVVENRSSVPIRDVVVSVRETQYKFAELKPGETRAFSARPRGESGVAVSYTIEGRVIQVPEQGYFEDNPHYVVILGLSDTGATVETTIKTEKPY